MYGVSARVIEAEGLGNFGAYHFYSTVLGSMIIVVNKDYDSQIQEEGRFHEAREIFWISKGFSQHEAHIIASAEQVEEFSKGNSLTSYHAAQIKAMSAEQLESIAEEDEYARQQHHMVLEEANRTGADIDIEEILQYEQKLRAGAQEQNISSLKLKEFIREDRDGYKGCEMVEIDCSGDIDEVVENIKAAVKSGRAVSLNLTNLKRALSWVDIGQILYSHDLSQEQKGRLSGLLFKRSKELGASSDYFPEALIKEMGLEKKFEDMLLNLLWQSQFMEVDRVFAQIAVGLNSEFGVPKRNLNDIDQLTFAVYELLKNAFVHGGRCDLSLPIGVRIVLDDNKAVLLQVINITARPGQAEEEAKAKLAVALGEELYGKRWGIDTIKRYGDDYQRLTDKKKSVTFATVLFPRPKEALVPIQKDKQRSVRRLGGIDFRFLPIVTQSMDNLKASIGFVSQANLRNIDLVREWSDIERLADAGIIPSAERLKDYLAASCFKDNLDGDAVRIVKCISDILRKEEETCCVTDPILKDILVVLGSGRSGQELKIAFSR